jgi:transcriptional regulator with XRE-family HTH domain
LWRSWLSELREEAPAAAIGPSLRRLREQRGLTQAELAARLDTTQSEVSKLERRADARLSTVRSYVAALGGRLLLTARFPGGDEDGLV